MARKITEYKLTSISKGRYSELLAQTALLANGWTIMEPISPEPFDLAIKRIGDKQTFYVQVKTASVRSEERYGGEWVIVKGSKNNGQKYTKEEVDYLVTVHNGEVYMFDNRECSEYWVRPWLIDERWTKLEYAI